MKVEFLEAAALEYCEAIDYYNLQEPGLGLEFNQEVRRTLQRIIDFPAAWQKMSRRTRRCRTKRFPYGLIYQIRKDMILVVAVMHLKRKPGYWRERLDGLAQ